MNIKSKIKQDVQITYPEIYLPYGIYKYLCKDSIEPEKPIAPDEPVKKDLPEVSGIVFLAITFVCFALVYSILNSNSLLNSASTIVSLFGSFVVGGLVYGKILDIKQKPVIEENRRAREDYLIRKNNYEEKMREYEISNAIYNNYKDKIEYRNRCIRDYFDNNEIYSYKIDQYDEVKEGASETYFKKYLICYMEDKFNFDEKGCPLKMHEGLKIEYFPEYHSDDEEIICSPEKAYFYYPDIVVTDGKGVFFDIEIDETYTLDSHNPIHYLETIYDDDNNKRMRSVDFNRNNEFAASGWVVVRFSETQILNKPRECAKVICDLYDCILDYKKFEKYDMPDVFVESKWDFSTSVKSAKENTRETLLNNKLVANVVAYF